MPDYKKVYEILDQLTPMKIDCGRLCDAACCQIDRYSETMGIYMLPGEDCIHDKNDPWLQWSKEKRDDLDFPESWPEDIWFVRCQGPSRCKRALRPIQCRTFPCWPYISENGQLAIMMLDIELPYECPLIENSDNINPAFFRQLYEGWSLLIEDKAIYEMIWQDSRLADQGDEPVNIVYKP